MPILLLIFVSFVFSWFKIFFIYPASSQEAIAPASSPADGV